MDRGPIPGPEKGHKATKPAPRKSGLNTAARSGRWYIVGTVNIDGRKIRVRESTGLAATLHTRPQAETRAFEKEKAIRDQAASGLGENHYIGIAAERYLNAPRARRLGASSVLYVTEIVKTFGTRRIRDIFETEWSDWVDARHAGNKPQTRERFLGTVLAFLNWCAKKPRRWIHPDQVPAFDRDNAARNPRRRARRQVADLRMDLIEFMISHAAPHLAPQLWTEWSTGARVSSILHGCRLCDVMLAPGRETITFHNTKNGTTVTAALHPRAAKAIAFYLTTRGKLHWREGPLFLDHKNEPYSTSNAGGNKTAFNAMKRRARRALRRRELTAARAAVGAIRVSIVAQLRADHRLLGKVTQHWFRHMMATHFRGDIRAAMDQAGWIDERSVMGYMIDVPGQRRRAIADLDQDQAGAATAEIKGR